MADFDNQSLMKAILAKRFILILNLLFNYFSILIVMAIIHQKST